MLKSMNKHVNMKMWSESKFGYGNSDMRLKWRSVFVSISKTAILLFWHMMNIGISIQSLVLHLKNWQNNIN